MRLALKLISVTVLGIALVLAIDTFASVRRDITLFNADARHDSQVLGSAVSTMLRDVVRGGGQARALELLREVNAAQPSVELRWVWLGEPGEDPSQPQVSSKELEPVLKGENTLLTAKNHSGQECLFNYLPIAREGQRLGVLEISEPLTHLEAEHRAFILREALVMAGLIAFSGLAAVVLGAVWVGWPLSRLIEKVRCVGRGDLASPLRIRGRHEFGELALAINTMCGQLAESHEKVEREHAARIRTLQQLRHADRLTTVGSLASGIAHELGTPLNVISARAKLIAEGEVPQDEIPENARTIRAQAQRMTTIIRQLLDFARRRPLTKTQVDFREVADHVVDLLSPLARKRGVTLSLDGGAERLSTRIDLGQMEQVVTNLVVNAIQASPPGGAVVVALGHERARPRADPTAAATDYVRLSVEDHGTGIAAEDQPRVFEPFFTTKDIGEGTGLGLSIAHGIAQEHGGWIEFESEPERGSRFSLGLPMVEGALADDPSTGFQGNDNHERGGVR
ncbi:MAG: HAMP domain-containing sensor histidine kinase [Planctomycetia bacterium]|nr:HAMP domain-containing sensor histidine kinase [Planctomycetia bacterium]